MNAGYPLLKKENFISYCNINQRRYLGNKTSALDFINDIIKKEIGDFFSFCDIFSGTGSVANFFNEDGRKIISNDLLYANYVSLSAWLDNVEFDTLKVEQYIAYLNSLDASEDNYSSIHFGNKYFSLDNAKKIGAIREEIEFLYKNRKIIEKEKNILLTSLLYAMDRVANTVGHYDAYREKMDSLKSITLEMPYIKYNSLNEVYNMDANELVKKIDVDVLYLDPPYNSRQYSDSYHVLENIMSWEKPDVFGKCKKFDRTNIKSKYSLKSATEAFEELIENAKAKYILLSYNNTENKRNGRSNAKMKDSDIIRILEKKGKVKIFETDYKTFNTGNTKLLENKERIFLCICGKKTNEEEKKKNKQEYIKSPLNYTGGKGKLLNQIIPILPPKTDLFVDLFCGGCNIGLNIDSDKVIFNDNNKQIINLFKFFQTKTSKFILSKIEQEIKKYKLSDTVENNYNFYKCNSSKGLGEYNKEGYLQLRKDFNLLKSKTSEYYIKFYLLIAFSFNNQVRFNNKGEFNLPVGKRDFNNSMKNKLNTFINEIKDNKYIFINQDFLKFDVSILDENSFVYIDPPYLITCASYNEQDGWNEEKETQLLNFLDLLDSKKIKFALSNVLRSRGKENNLLINWLENRNYIIHQLNFKYSNSNYQIKDKQAITEEVLITNYKEDL